MSILIEDLKKTQSREKEEEKEKRKQEMLSEMMSKIDMVGLARCSSISRCNSAILSLYVSRVIVASLPSDSSLAAVMRSSLSSDDMDLFEKLIADLREELAFLKEQGAAMSKVSVLLLGGGVMLNKQENKSLLCGQRGFLLSATVP
jgi:kinesin family protein 5